MNFALWTLAGGILGWLGYAYFDMNEGRGKMVSIAIGAMGGFIGGKMIAPMFTAAAVTGDFSMSALFFAAAVAAAFLAAGSFIDTRWGV